MSGDLTEPAMITAAPIADAPQIASAPHGKPPTMRQQRRNQAFAAMLLVVAATIFAVAVALTLGIHYAQLHHLMGDT